MSFLEPEPAPEEDDTDYVPEVVVVTGEILSSASALSTNLEKCLDASPTSTLKRARLVLNAKSKEGYR